MQVQLLSSEQLAAAHTSAFLGCLRGWALPEEDDKGLECEDCTGTGESVCSKCYGDGETDCECSNCGDDHSRVCRLCDGTGTTGKCRECHGSGFSIDPTTIIIRHPADEWTISSLLPISLNGSFI